MTDFIRSATLVIRIRRDDFKGYERTIRITGLRVAFNIQKNLAWSTNTGTIKVWNLDASTRNLIKDFGDEVTIYAGYERGSGEELLFVGDTTSVSHMYTIPDVITTLECGDGDRYANQKFFSLSFQANTPARDVLLAIADKMGIPVSEISNSANVAYDRGYQFAGLGKEAIAKVCARMGLQASIQNEMLQIVPINGTNSRPIIDINANTGMIGVPQRYTYKRQDLYKKGPAVGWKVTTLCKPLIYPGCRLNISSSFLSFEGMFRCETIKHTGDTYGALWQSEMEVTQVSL